jgi:hypothetical protein
LLIQLLINVDTLRQSLILVVGHRAKDVTVPAHAKWKKPLEEIMTAF